VPTGTPTPTPTATPTATAAATPTPIATPAAPSNLAATPLSCLSIRLAWQDNSNNEGGFKIERGEDGINFYQLATVPANTITYVSNLVSSGLRYFRVRAYNAAGNSAYSNVAGATAPTCTPTATPIPIGTATPAPTSTATPRPTSTATSTPTPTRSPTPTPIPTPHPPSEFAATVVGCHEIHLTWTYSFTDETGFNIDRGRDGVNYTRIAQAPSSARAYNDFSAPSGVNYYRIQAYNGGGGGLYDTTSAAEPTCTPTPTPTNGNGNANFDSKANRHIDATTSHTDSNPYAPRSNKPYGYGSVIQRDRPVQDR
jgi:hypothetical protein